jgi:GNAT superfamily N-acetyltransferase
MLCDAPHISCETEREEMSPNCLIRRGASCSLSVVPDTGTQPVLTPLTGELADEVAAWFVDDDEGRRRLDADFYGGFQPRWWSLVQRCARRYGWVGLADEVPVGFVDMEVVDEEGSLTIYIRRAFRRQGLGTALLRLAAVEARAMNVAALVGHAESDYVASIRCLVAAGFSE